MATAPGSSRRGSGSASWDVGVGRGSGAADPGISPPALGSAFTLFGSETPASSVGCALFVVVGATLGGDSCAAGVGAAGVGAADWLAGTPGARALVLVKTRGGSKPGNRPFG